MNTIAAKPLLESMAGVPRIGFSKADVSYRDLSVAVSYAFIEPAVAQSEEKKAVITFHLPRAVSRMMRRLKVIHSIQQALSHIVHTR